MAACAIGFIAVALDAFCRFMPQYFTFSLHQGCDYILQVNTIFTKGGKIIPKQIK